jgi:tRNA threonylcarbamoyladenosine biosynthesis protein TsaE
MQRVGEAAPFQQQHLADAAATKRLGRELAVLLPAGSLLLLSGALGAGKTSLVQGLAEGLGVEETVTSPTFALAQYYGIHLSTTDPLLIHVDLYRLELTAAADELFAQEEENARQCQALLAVEWPERLSAIPNDAWWLQLSLATQGRHYQLWSPQN